MNLINSFQNIQDIEIELGKDLSKFSTMRLEATGDVVTIKTVNALKIALRKFSEEKQEFLVLGLGANQLLKSKSSIPYLMLKLEKNDTELCEDAVKDSYIINASVRLSTLTSFAAKMGLRGWEVFTGVPATLGGAIYMNAGTGLGEIAQVVSRVWIMNSEGEERVETINQTSFSYRKNNFVKKGEVIFKAELIHRGIDLKLKDEIREYLTKRNNSQPMSEWTCGCVFKNSSFDKMTCPAGKYIDILGIKGLQIKGIRVSEKHGNFMENFSEATYEDVDSLIKIVQEELYLQFGVKFELEVKV